jgi:hypothetical protein
MEGLPGLHLHTSRLINLHLSVYISAYACTKSLIFDLHQSTWGGYWTPIPKGFCPTATQDLCAPKPTLVVQIQDKQILSDCWTSRVTSKSPPLTTKGCWKLMKCTLWNVAIWSPFSLFALNWYQTSKSSVTYTCTNNQLWLSMVVTLWQCVDMNGGAFHMVTLMAGKTMLCIARG